MNQRARRKSRSFCFKPTDKSKPIPINRNFVIFKLLSSIFRNKSSKEISHEKPFYLLFRPNNARL
jgi:hypothetical protein